MQVFRIAQKDFITDLSGEGARLFGGRWNRKGTPLLYTAETRSLAALEILVHVQNLSSISNLAQLILNIPDSTKIDDISNIISLPTDWQKYPAMPELQDAVEEWLKSGNLVLKVPSAIIKEEFNYLINPKSKMMNEIKIISNDAFSLDERFENIRSNK